MVNSLVSLGHSWKTPLFLGHLEFSPVSLGHSWYISLCLWDTWYTPLCLWDILGTFPCVSGTLGTLALCLCGTLGTFLCVPGTLGTPALCLWDTLGTLPSVSWARSCVCGTGASRTLPRISVAPPLCLCFRTLLFSPPERDTFCVRSICSPVFLNHRTVFAFVFVPANQVGHRPATHIFMHC